MTQRAGIGYDVHSFAAGRRLVLGGVTIDGHAGLQGHSDADVVCHSVIDALLGAAAIGDLGSHFPGNDRWKDASSVTMLTQAAESLRKAGWEPENVDVTIVAQEPRLAPHVHEIARNIASALTVDVNVVSVKSTSTDGLGSIGRGEGIACLAIATVSRVP